MDNKQRHYAAIGIAVLIEIGLLAGMIFGRGSLENLTGDDRSVRTMCFAAWALLVPAWFALETRLFSPPPTEPQKVADFARAQQTGQIIATLLGALVGVIIGTTPG